MAAEKRPVSGSCRIANLNGQTTQKAPETPAGEDGKKDDVNRANRIPNGDSL